MSWEPKIPTDGGAALFGKKTAEALLNYADLKKEVRRLEELVETLTAKINNNKEPEQ